MSINNSSKRTIEAFFEVEISCLVTGKIFMQDAQVNKHKRTPKNRKVILQKDLIEVG